MSTQHPSRKEFALVIDDRQLHYIRLAMKDFVENDPGWEQDHNGQDVPTVLYEKLRGPLKDGLLVNNLTV